MSISKKDLGVAQALLQRLNEFVLPHAFDMKARVDRGERLTHFDRMVLQQMADDQRFIPGLVARQPQFELLAEQVRELIDHITTRARVNEEPDADPR